MKQFLYRVNLVIVVSFFIYCSSLALLRDVVAFAAETVALPFDKSQLAVEAETRQPKASVTSQHKAFKKKVAIKADGNRCPLMSKSQQRVVKLLYFLAVRRVTKFRQLIYGGCFGLCRLCLSSTPSSVFSSLSPIVRR